ncbi:methionine aminopeptidase [Alkalihalobacillus sp. MEB130]|uniref:methionine aminopeptidase n=1 Tax=Alkalihalobacillus sp. MEB130 TaxID=2976704 RepID=UPI0028DE7CCC|nr:methionine aminopeptidase [Alkalihalobacillus sp. MEB130]MDT8859651.1 methionine aminopeptidase [Alkalihalobacillus sp. MEB130]
MGIMQVFDDWIEKKREKRIAFAESQGTCPECQGRGFTMLGSEMYTLHSYYDCGGCNGSGSYSDWVETN